MSQSAPTDGRYRAAGPRNGEGIRIQDRESLLAGYERVRDFTLALCKPLAPEDHVLQNMPDVSPTKWHLAHTTWFFERFVLADFGSGYAPIDPRYDFLFNSYYNAVGVMHARPKRGHLSRPTVAEVLAYRREIDRRLGEFLLAYDGSIPARVAERVELGCHHEQQHQELILTDIKYNLSCNPMLPSYREAPETPGPARAQKPTWIDGEGGVREIGCAGPGFCFDNEGPRHEVLLRPHALASHPVINGAYREFIADGGYERPELWLDLGWATLAKEGWRHPLYWVPRDGAWCQYTLGGLLPLDADEPVCHVSFFEADAFARWSGQRLPGEAEWEVAAADQPLAGNLAESGRFHVAAAPHSPSESGFSQLYGDVWEWTASPYVGYPGYRPPPGAIGEYNGKFMCNQVVLRGGSCATSQSHLRPSYRNFFPPEARWQFSGFRLARDA